jgi:hypothetical protein
MAVPEKRSDSMMNPAALGKLKDQIVRFQYTHPKFVTFVRDTFSSGIPESSIVEISITKPGMEKVTTNIRVQQSDLELLDNLKNIR